MWFCLSGSRQSLGSSKSSSRSHQAEFHLSCQGMHKPWVYKHCVQELFPLCFLTWAVARHSLGDLSRGAQWWALFRILEWRLAHGRSGVIAILTLQLVEKHRDVMWLWAHLHEERGCVGSQIAGPVSTVWRIWPKSYSFSPFITQRD